MKKFKLNKQKLNLKTLTTPLLALSLMAGCAGLFGGSASAATVTNNVVLDIPAPVYNLGDLLTSISSPSAPFDATPSLPVPPGINNTYDAGEMIDNPCTITPVDITATVTMQTNAFSTGGGGGDINYLIISDSVNTDVKPINFTATNQNFTETVAISSTTASQILVDLAIELDEIALPNIVKVSNFTYTLTYPDNMPDCTYPAANSAPTANPDTATTPANTPITTNVLSNDSDPDGDTLTISKINDNSFTVGVPITLPDGSGTVTVNADNTVTFVPAVGFTGTTSYTYNNSDGNSQSYTTVTITVTASTTPALYCPSPYSTTTLLTPSGDCDEDGITNQTEGFDPDGDGNPNTGTAPIDTDGDSIPDYLDLDTDNDGILDSEEKGTASDSSTNPADTDKDGTPDFRDLDSDNDSTKDIKESGRNYTDTNNDGKVDGSVNTYGIASSSANPSDPKTLSTTSLQDSNNNGIADFRENPSTLAKTGANLTIILTLAVIGLVGGLGLKRVRG